MTETLDKIDSKVTIHELYEQYYNTKEETRGTFKGKRGIKTCPGCIKTCGARCKVCPNCQREFIEGEKYVPPKELTPEEEFEQKYVSVIGNGLMIYTPTDKINIEPYLTKQGVEEWCDLVVEEGQRNKKIYMPSALIYLMRNYIDVNDKKFDKIKKWIYGWSTKLVESI